ncbi:hypothetical protein CsSME_00025368 [Camellia sinensis var. sinensis]
MPSSIFKLSSFLVASMAIIFLFPSLHSFPPAEAIRSSSLLLITHNSIHQFSYKNQQEHSRIMQSNVSLIKLLRYTLL